MDRRSPSLPLLAVVAALSLAVAGCGGGGDGQDDEVVARSSPPDAEAGAGPTSADAGVVVDVAGLVRRPGVYRMRPGARVHEAIQAAGGVRRGAALGALNRAAVLVDGQQVVVGGGSSGPAGAGADGGAVGGAADGTGSAKVNLNTADAAALEELPGIGEVTAGHIVASREEAGPFASVDDLDRVPGIGPTTIEALRTVATT